MLQIEKGQDIKQELLQRYKTILPDELIEIWEDNGLARLMGGYLKVVNPEDYQELLKETYFRGNISVPILVTAFGDIVTFEEGQYIGMVKYFLIKACHFLCQGFPVCKEILLFCRQFFFMGNIIL